MGITKNALAACQNATDPGEEELSQSSQLVQFIKEHYMIFRDNNKSVFVADLQTAEIFSIDSRSFRDALVAGFYADKGKAARDYATKEALSVIAGIGRRGKDVRQVNIRVGVETASYFLDLATPGEGRAISLEPRHWKVVDNPTAMFIRPESMQPLPEPIGSNNLDSLWPLVNIPTNQQLLIIAWLVECLRPDTPFPVLELLGEQGSAKSTTQKILRRLIDPNGCDLRATPKSSQDVFVSAGVCHLLSVENVSHLPVPIQDAFCTVATGGGFATRKLYSDADEIVIAVKRPIILNGISASVTQQDLVDRTITVELPEIQERREVSEIWQSFDREHPKLLGALMDIAANALAELPNITLPKEKPRLIEFVRLGMAVSVAMGHSCNDFLDQFDLSKQESLARTIDASPVATAIIEWTNSSPEGCQASVKDLMHTIEPYKPDRCDSWPRTPRGFADAMRRAAPALRQLGVECRSLGKIGGTVQWAVRKRNLPT